MKSELTSFWDRRVLELRQSGLSICADAILVNCMIAQQEGRGDDNRGILVERIKNSLPSQRVDAIRLFDEFCAAGFGSKKRAFKIFGA